MNTVSSRVGNSSKSESPLYSGFFNYPIFRKCCGGECGGHQEIAADAGHYFIYLFNRLLTSYIALRWREKHDSSLQ